MSDNKRERKIKFFIWDDPYVVSYGSSYLIVAAYDLRQARRLAKSSKNGQYPDDPYTRQGVNVDKIEPSRVCDLPYAESLEWSE